MPASRSTRQSTEKPGVGAAPAPAGDGRARPRSYWVLVPIAVLAALAVLMTALPSSLATRFLPPIMHADDLSGTIWHGAAGKITVQGRDAGALEWHLYPAALLEMTLRLDLHWAHEGFGVDAVAAADRHGLSLTAIHGGGPVEDLRKLGAPAAWRGTANIALDSLSTDYTRLLSIRGDVGVAEVSSAQVVGGADLGNYVLHFGDDAVDASGIVKGSVHDAGGPLKVQGTVILSQAQHTGTLSGTVQETAEASADLRSELNQLAQMRGRDAQGRIPVDLEFNF